MFFDVKLYVMQTRGKSEPDSCKEKWEHNKTPMDAWHWKFMENNEFGVMEMPVQGSNPGAPRGIFGGNNYGLPHPSSVKTIQGGLSPLDWQTITKLPQLGFYAQDQEFTGSQDFCQSFCEKISVKSKLFSKSFPRDFPGASAPLPFQDPSKCSPAAKRAGGILTEFSKLGFNTGVKGKPRF